MDDVCPWDAAPGPSTSDHPSSVAPAAAASSVDGVASTPSVSGMAVSVDVGGPVGLQHQHSTTLEPRTSRKNSSQFDSCSSSSDVSIALVDATERLKKTCVLHQYPVGPGPGAVTRNYSVGSSSTAVRVKLADTARPSVSSCSYPSPSQSFDLPHLLVEKPEVASSVRTVPEEGESSRHDEHEREDGRRAPLPTVGKSPAMAPLISISAIVGEIADDGDRAADDDEPAREEDGSGGGGDDGGEIDEAADATACEVPRVTLVEETEAEEAQVVPVWEPEEHHEPPETEAATAQNPTEQRDNNVNEVCPWEDE